jgi:streptogramin lyase
MRQLSSIPLYAAMVAAAILSTGCATSFDSSPVATQSPVGLIQGNLHGGSQPITGAHVFLFAAGRNVSAVPGAAPTSSTASTSLLVSVSGGHPTTFDSTIGGYYATTDGIGNFSLTGSYTCTAGQQVYIYTQGGNAGAGNNTAIGLMAILGQCPASGSMASVTPFVLVNEVSTVAAAYSIAPFAVDPTHVSDDEAATGNATAANATVGMANAFANANNMYAVGGNGLALSTTPAGNGIVPQTELHSLANSLAGCVNSSGPGSSSCSTLFSLARSQGTSGTAPTDTAGAILNIAHYPNHDIAAIFALAPSVGAPFQPSLSSAPNDFGVALTFSGPGLSAPVSLAVDASGNIWTANTGNNSVSKILPTGAVAGNFVGGGLNNPFDIAVDTPGNLWISNFNGNSLSKFTSAGVAVGTGFTGGGLSSPTGVAVDGTGNVWTANIGNSTVSKFSGTGVAQSGTGFTGSGLSSPASIAIDASGNAWVGNQSGNKVSEFTNAGSPVGSGFSGGGVGAGYGIAIGATGTVWVVSGNNNVLSVYTNAGVPISSTGYTGGGMNSPVWVSLDGSNFAFIANVNTSGMTEMADTGAPITNSNGYNAANLAQPTKVAVDPSGNVWVANHNSLTVTEFVGMGAPVVTPLAAGVAASKLATRP